jgi:hypothetical protein
VTTLETLPVALRAYATRGQQSDDDAVTKRWRPEHVVVFDTETTIDAGQQLNFGSWRYYRVTWPDDGAEPIMRCAEEGFFYDDGLEARYPRGYRALKRFCEVEPADVDLTLDDAAIRLTFYSRSEFVEEVLHRVGYQWPRAAIVGFNLPFDLSRLALRASEGRDFFRGGFSLPVSRYTLDDTGDAWDFNQYRSRVGIKTIDSKRHLISFRKPKEVDDADRVPDETTGKEFRGHFLDLRTLAFALTNESYSLKRACEDFKVPHGKTEPKQHGLINKPYIAYNRRDVKATGELFAKLMHAYLAHPISLQATKAYSPASIGKAYLSAMRIKPILKRQPDFPVEVLGYAMNAYYGGRAECRIRRTRVPIVYCDFLSMYPTVNALMGLWKFVTAEHLEIQDDENATKEIRRLVDDATVETCLDPATWRAFPALVQIEPDGDVLPVRARYTEGGSWQIGVNPITTREHLWYALPDVIAAKLLSPDSRSPRIIRALRLVPDGKQRGMRRVKLGGEIEVRPGREDFFRSVIEQRKRVSRDERLPKATRERLSQFLKVLANATSYGIYAEMVRDELGSKRETVTVHRIDGTTFEAPTNAPEDPGTRFFGPMAALITSAARLMLALAERSVTDRGGIYAFCDTDSIAIVSTQAGGLVPCPGGPHRTETGTDAVRALSWDEVEQIRTRFEALNPYDLAVVPGSVLELEDDNFDGPRRTAPRRQLYCYAISAKRYAFYALDELGEPLARAPERNSLGELIHPGEKISEHGLGHLLNPTDPDSDDRAWMRQIWRHLIRRDSAIDDDEPRWANRPAISRMTVTTPAALKPFATYNAGRPWRQQVKPFNFMLTAHVKPFGHPEGTDPSHFHLTAPHESDPARWERMTWINRYTGESHSITSAGEPTSTCARIQTYRDTVSAYGVHPESKSADLKGLACARTTVGLLARRPIRLGTLTYVGKESNSLGDVAAGLIHDEGEVLNEYRDSARSTWNTLVRPVLAHAVKSGISLAEIARLSASDRGTVARQLAGIQQPTPKKQRRLMQIAMTFIGASDCPSDSALRQYVDNLGGSQIHRVCADCGRELSAPRAKHCQACRQRRYRERSRLPLRSGTQRQPDGN